MTFDIVCLTNRIIIILMCIIQYIILFAFQLPVKAVKAHAWNFSSALAPPGCYRPSIGWPHLSPAICGSVDHVGMLGSNKPILILFEVKGHILSKCVHIYGI